MRKFRDLFLLIIIFFGCSPATEVKTEAPTPNAYQTAWQDMEYYFFAHFGPNTFTGLEWGEGTEPTEIFNPTELDCDQWVQIAKESGAKGIIITAKHHDGFCLWPSKYSTHTVRESPWKDGKGDVLRELSDACKKYDIKFGVYLSPWDRNHPAYGTPEYNDVFANMLEEIFENYGPIWELWWDGANGEGPNGKKQIYDFPRFEKLVRKLSPATVIFSDIGPDVRWCGNEKGFAGVTNWNLLDTAGFKRGEGAPSTDTLNSGNVFGKHWIPAECDVSIRPGWFYHKDETPKTPEELFQIYLKSVGRGANLLLNVPPDTRGLFTAEDSASLMGFYQLRQNNFNTDRMIKGSAHLIVGDDEEGADNVSDSDVTSYISLSTDDNNYLVYRFKDPAGINCVELQENLADGQNCASFELQLVDAGGNIVRTVDGTTIGHKRILTFPTIEADALRVIIKDQRAATKIGELKVYHIDDNLVEK